MVCTYCQQKTRVINSRPQLRSNGIWRRRKCTACGETVTSIESLDYEKTWVVQYSPRQKRPFLRDKLFVSIYKSCQHRPSAFEDARGLTATVIAGLWQDIDKALISPGLIARRTHAALHRFDKPAAVHYQAFHADVL